MKMGRTEYAEEIQFYIAPANERVMMPGVFAGWGRDLFNEAMLTVAGAKNDAGTVQQSKSEVFESYKRSTSLDSFYKVNRALFAFATKGVL